MRNVFIRVAPNPFAVRLSHIAARPKESVREENIKIVFDVSSLGQALDGDEIGLVDGARLSSFAPGVRNERRAK